MITNENIVWIMKRYNHDNPHQPNTTRVISILIGEDIYSTRRRLNEMAEFGLVKKIQESGKSLKWSAV